MISINERISCHKETFFLAENEHGIEHIEIERYDNGTTVVGVYDVNGNNLSEIIDRLSIESILQKIYSVTEATR